MALVHPRDMRFYEHQADATLITATPVSGTKYTVLDTTTFVRLISIYSEIYWGVTQPTPLEVHLTVDGQAIIFIKADPVSGTDYFGHLFGEALNASLSTTDYIKDRPFILEGKSV